MLDPADDPFALARLEHPGCKFVLVRDPDGLGLEFVLSIAPTSQAFELLPDTQTVTINRKAKAGAAMPAHLPRDSAAAAPADASTEVHPGPQ